MKHTDTPTPFKRPTLKLTGQRNFCQCGHHFNSNAAHAKHRVGDFADRTRRCMTPEEMLAAGMVKNAAGYWITSAFDPSHLVATAKPRKAPPPTRCLPRPDPQPALPR